MNKEYRVILRVSEKEKKEKRKWKIINWKNKRNNLIDLITLHIIYVENNLSNKFLENNLM